jgi:hypothetical protein
MSIAPVRTINEYIDTVLRLRTQWSPSDPLPELWYRGINDQSLQLLPGAYWRKNCDETSLVVSFRAMSPSLLVHEPLDAWEWYYLMQHYGVPTRLLDWTEAPLSALYFALEKPQVDKAPCVWMLDPLALNGLSGLDYIPIPRVTGPTKRWLTDYCERGKARPFNRPKHARFKDNSQPLAIFPKRHNPRIVAQRGAFTIHGAGDTPIEKLEIKNKLGTEPRIERIPIDPAARDFLWDQLWALGINKTSIYPEPQSLADDLRRLYNTA